MDLVPLGTVIAFNRQHVHPRQGDAPEKPNYRRMAKAVQGTLGLREALRAP